MPITVLDLAIHRGAKEDPNGGLSAKAIEATGLQFFSGCGPCTASLGPFDAYPSDAKTASVKMVSKRSRKQMHSSFRRKMIRFRIVEILIVIVRIQEIVLAISAIRPFVS